ncbi:MAG TPA: 50S ribosomal protein L29 [Chroococcales cyanobacterium]
MKYSEIQGLGLTELNEKLRSAKGELFNLRFQLAVRQLENTAKLRDVKHELAQIQTAIREKELAGGK